MKFREYNQKQLWLIPPNIEDEIPADDICRVIDEVIDSIDLKCIENKYGEEGNPAFHPRMMLKTLFYSYSRGIFSSRIIAQEFERNIFYWYLSGKQKPDFRTICFFRSKHIEELKLIFHEVVKLCLRLGLAEIRSVALDGTKIKANASHSKNRDKKWLEDKIKEESEALEETLNKAEKVDAEEDQKYGANLRGDEIPKEIRNKETRIEKLKRIKQELEQSNYDRVNETDEDAHVMKSQGKYLTGYNCQAVVDTESQIVLTADVSSVPNDFYQLTGNIDEIEKVYNEKPDIVLADKGYFQGENLKYFKDNNIDGYIPDKPIKDIKAELKGEIKETKKYKKDQFNYDKDKDIYICPEGKILKNMNPEWQEQPRKNGKTVKCAQYQCGDCLQCKSREKCTKNKVGRCITRYEDEELREEMAGKIRSDQGYEIYKQRCKTIEPAFGNMKQNIGFREFSLRRLVKTRGEFFIVVTVHNIMKIKSQLDKLKKAFITQVALTYN